MKLILVKPVMTEKALGTKKRSVFIVTRTSTKHEIKEAIEKMYKVEVSSVRTLVRKGKVKAVGRKRLQKKQSVTKKAYITLSKGEISDAQTA